ncbi:hypothetical protein F5Y10DRAFT_287907 [Nemania abortiva]|nr:hypothetical protein F5Y10DRAFT_287907 [Nemania abortiva]
MHSIFKRPRSKSTIKRSELIRLTKPLDSAFLPISYFEAFEDKRGYDIDKRFPTDLRDGGIERLLQDHWNSIAPSIYTLNDYDLGFDASRAGCEWAACLRVRDPSAVILRVYPRDRYSGGAHILCQLLSSLICNFATLARDELDNVPDLSKANFEILAQGGAVGVSVGLRILEALPPFQFPWKMLCVVDGLGLAKTDSTINEVAQLKAILERIITRNRGHLLYTVAKQDRTSEYRSR